MNYVELANEKFRGDKNVSFTKPLVEFICECYIKLPPCSYGTRISEKIRLDLSANYISARLEKGDFEYNGIFYEQKVSFLSGTYDKWRVTHIRPWQKFKYFVFCFIDCENGFEPNFYVLNRVNINRFKLHAMNGTDKSNSDNSNIELSANFSKDSHEISTLRDMNLLGLDRSFESLKRFVQKENVLENQENSYNFVTK